MGFFRKPDVARLKAERDAKALLKALDYSWDTDVRITAAQALGELRVPGAADALARHLSALAHHVSAYDKLPKPELLSYVEALGRVGGACAVAALAELFSTPDPHVLNAGAAALRAIGTPAALAALQEGERRREAVESGQVADKNYLDFHLNRLEWGSAEASLDSADRLVRLGNLSVLPSILRVATAAHLMHPRETARRSAFRVLAAMPANVAVPELHKIIGSAESGKMFEGLHSAYKDAQHGAREAAKQETEVLRLALEALGQSSPEEAKKALDARQRRAAFLATLAAPTQSPAPVVLPLALAGPGEFVVRKVLGGILSGGILAVKQDVLDLGGGVKLPESCCLCGELAGEDKIVNWGSFQLGPSAVASLGMPAGVRAYLEYRVCHLCNREAKYRQEALRFQVGRNDANEWHIEIMALNHSVARMIRELNA